MKRRVIIATTTLIILTAAYIVSRIFLASKYYGLIDMFSLLVIVFDFIYLWFGLSRLIVYFIYGVFMIPSLFFFPKEYHILLIFIFTIIIVLNPLAGFEKFLNSNLKDNYTKTFTYVPKGKYEIFHKYKKEMKNHYHLPQTQKFYTKPYYRLLSTVTILGLFFSLIFLLLFSSSDIVIDEGWNVRSFITLYVAILFTIALLVLYKKGFVSTSRVFKIGIFPPIIIILSVLDYNNVLKTISIIGLVIGFLTVIVNEIIQYYIRVVYSSYNYYNPKTNEDVWANALYEPFVYSSIEKKMKLITITLPEELFHKNFKSLLIATNYYKTIITAYSLKKGTVKLYIEYYREGAIEKIKRSIEKIYNVKIEHSQIVDEAYYETQFLHNHEYIIAKAIKLSNLLIELDIDKPVIISVFMHFKNIEDVKSLAKKFQTKLLEDEEKYCLVESSITVQNIDYLIETHLRNLLLEMLIKGGTFVRVMVYY